MYIFISYISHVGCRESGQLHRSQGFQPPYVIVFLHFLEFTVLSGT